MSPASKCVAKKKLLLAQIHPSKQQGLMLLDTSQPGWQILHSDCDDERLHAKYTAGRSFWEAFAVADMVRPLCYVPSLFPLFVPTPDLMSCTHIIVCSPLTLLLLSDPSTPNAQKRLYRQQVHQSPCCTITAWHPCMLLTNQGYQLPVALPPSFFAAFSGFAAAGTARGAV
jgi:hypothetical protein